MNDYVIMAAGRGARLWPITEDIPKTMVRVLKKPLLEWLVEGILPDARKIVLVVGFHKEKIIDFFKSKPYAQKIVFCEQREQKGTAHALLQAREAVGDSFIVFNGDNFFHPKIFDVVKENARAGEWFAVGKRVQDVSEFGVLESRGGRLAGVVEKKGAREPGLANTNTLFMPREFFDYLERTRASPRGELELTDALKEFAEKHAVKTIEFAEYWSDIAFFWNYLDANAFALEHLMKPAVLGEIEQGAVLKGKVFVGKGTLVRSTTRIEGPVFVGENCVIGPNAFLRPGTTVEDNCHVGSSEVKNSVIMRDSNAPHFCYVGDSVVCEDVNLGAGTTTANLRFDDKTVPSTDPKKKQKIDSGRRKLGCVVGAGTRVGINASINCGVLIGRKCKVFPHTFVKHDLPDEAVYKETAQWND